MLISIEIPVGHNPLIVLGNLVELFYISKYNTVHVLIVILKLYVIYSIY